MYLIIKLVEIENLCYEVSNKRKFVPTTNGMITFKRNEDSE